MPADVQYVPATAFRALALTQSDTRRMAPIADVCDLSGAACWQGIGAAAGLKERAAGPQHRARGSPQRIGRQGPRRVFRRGLSRGSFAGSFGYAIGFTQAHLAKKCEGAATSSREQPAPCAGLC